MERLKGSNTWVSVYEFVRDNIIEGTYCPGEKLNEREIAQLTNLSRTPTREALRVLEYEGFVTLPQAPPAVVSILWRVSSSSGR